MIALALIWLAAFVLAIAATRQPLDRRRMRWVIAFAAVLVGLAIAAQVLA